MEQPFEFTCPPWPHRWPLDRGRRVRHRNGNHHERRCAELAGHLEANGHQDAPTVSPLPALSLVQDVLDRVSMHGARLEIDNIAADAAPVFAMIANGDTAGVFWFARM